MHHRQLLPFKCSSKSFMLPYAACVSYKCENTICNEQSLPAAVQRHDLLRVCREFKAEHFNSPCSSPYGRSISKARLQTVSLSHTMGKHAHVSLIRFTLKGSFSIGPVCNIKRISPNPPHHVDLIWERISFPASFAPLS